MDLDVYQICPCGSGKKIKFCCCSDLLSELDKVLKTIESKQYIAAIDQISRVTAAKGHRAALLQVLKTQVYIGLNDVSHAEEAISLISGDNSENPIVLALRGFVLLGRGDVDEAFDRYQDVLDASVPGQANSILRPFSSTLIHALILKHRYLTARSLIWWQVIMSNFEAEAVTQFRQLEREFNLPLLLRYPFEFSQPPEGSPNYKLIVEALRVAMMGRWRRAAEMLETLLPTVSDAERIHVHRNIARIRGWLPNLEAAAVAWQRLVTTPGLSEDEAIEVQAIAYLFANAQFGELVDILRISIPLKDSDRFMERCLSNPRLAKQDADSVEVEEGQPPPKASFALLSKPMPEKGAEITLDTVPRIQCLMLIFGRQTDREARVELTMIPRTSAYSEVLQSVAEIGGEYLADLESKTEEVDAQLPEFQLLTLPNLFLPAESHERALDLERENRKRVTLEKWPHIKLEQLDGKTPQQVASDPAYRIRLQALLLQLEADSWLQRWTLDVNELRRKLGLPEIRKVAFNRGERMGRSLVRLPRVDLSILPTESIIDILDTAQLFAVSKTIYDACQELLGRDLSGVSKIRKLELYAMAAANASRWEDALRYWKLAQDEAIAHRQPVARFLLEELRIRIARMELDEAQRLITTIRTKHQHEPGVMDALFQLLHSFGLIADEPDSAPAAPPVAAPQPAASSLWTPDRPAATAASPQKSKLWVPGMD